MNTEKIKGFQVSEIFEKAIQHPSYGYPSIVAKSEEEAAESIRAEAPYLYSLGGAVIVSSAFINRYPFIEGIVNTKGVKKVESDHSAIVFVEGETDDYVDKNGNIIKFDLFHNYQTGLPPVVSKISIVEDDDNDNIGRGWADLPAEIANLIK